MDVVLPGMKITVILHIPSELGDDQVHHWWAVIFWKKCFWAVSLSGGLKIFIKPCCKQICCYLCFVVSLIEHRPSTFSLILKGPGILWMVSIGFSFKSPSALTPNKRVSLPFQPLKLGIDFSYLTMKVPDSIFHKGCFYIENLLFSIYPPSLF